MATLREIIFGKRPAPYRWRELADYNSRVAKGIAHTPGYVEQMRREQEAFNVEQYGPDYRNHPPGFPIILDGRK